MTKPVRVKVEEQAHPNLRKLARALLALVEEKASKPPQRRKRKGSS